MNNFKKSKPLPGPDVPSRQNKLNNKSECKQEGNQTIKKSESAQESKEPRPPHEHKTHVHKEHQHHKDYEEIEREQEEYKPRN